MTREVRLTCRAFDYGDRSLTDPSCCRTLEFHLERVEEGRDGHRYRCSILVSVKTTLVNRRSSIAPNRGGTAYFSAGSQCW
jgi:hypothetical protein